jgi:dipeptide/tripeptide permease
MGESALSKMGRVFSTYPRTFWLINFIELLERGAYYGMLAIFTVYMVRTRGFSSIEVGGFLAVLQPLLYFVPLVAAALAEKYGYRISLILAFALLGIGYFALGSVSEPVAIIASIVALGVGAGAFKPIATAVVAQSTSPEQRNFGFVIYYMAVNMGAFLVPLAIAFTIPPEFYGLVFFVSAGLIALNVAIIFLLYRNVRPPQTGKSVFGALGALVGVFKDPPFLLLLLLYSGFWFMYAQFQFYAPLYMTDFHAMPDWFTPAFLATVNPGVIILLGSPIGKFVEKLPSLPTMIAGIGLYVAGTVFLGVVPGLFILGAVLVSIGEVVAHPCFYAYVSKIAPQDRVAVYLGYAFIPVGIGLTVGAGVGGTMYNALSEVGTRPKLYWAASAAVGLFTMAAFILYNRWITKKRAAPEVVAAPARRSTFDLVTKPAIAVVAILLIPAVIGAGYVGGTDRFDRVAELPPTDNLTRPIGILNVAPVTGTTAEGQSTERTVMVNMTNGTVDSVNFTLEWVDEAASSAATANTPDTFRFTVRLPNGETLRSQEAANPQGGSGLIQLGASTPWGGNGAYVITVFAVSCGDETVQSQALPVSPSPDNGNDWRMTLN